MHKHKGVIVAKGSFYASEKSAYLGIGHDLLYQTLNYTSIKRKFGTF